MRVCGAFDHLTHCPKHFLVFLKKSLVSPEAICGFVEKLR